MEKGLGQWLEWGMTNCKNFDSELYDEGYTSSAIKNLEETYRISLVLVNNVM